MASLIPSVDRRDYRIRITGVARENTDEALRKCGALASHASNPVKVRHFKESTIIHFYSVCDPVFVEEVAWAIIFDLCPDINHGLLEEFKEMLPPQELLAIA